MKPINKSHSEQIKRKRYEVRNRNYILSSSSSSSEDEDIDLYYLVEFIDSKEFSVIEKNKVKIDDNDPNMGRVMHRGKWYPCKLLKLGNKEYIERKSLKFQNFATVETSEDNRPTNSTKRSKFFGSKT